MIARGRALRYPDTFATVPVTIIVAGPIEVKPGQRQRFLDALTEAMRLARNTKGCENFVVAPDPLEAQRVNVLEVWRTRQALVGFRDGGPDDDLSVLIVRTNVRECEV